MKKLSLTLIGCFALTCLFSQSTPGSWVQKDSIPAVGRFWSFAFAVGGKGYAGTGRTGFSGNPTSDFWEYDPIADSWTQKADVPGGAKEGMDGFAIGDKGYAAFGTSFIQFQSTVHRYDPATNTWDQAASVPGGVGFAYSHGFVIDSTYYIGPENGTNKTYAYNGFTNTWTQKADYPGGDRRAQVAFAAGGKGYIGAGAGVFGGVLKNFYKYDPATDSWAQIADLSRATDQSTGFGIGNYGYIYHVGGNLKETYRYIESLNEWQFEASFPGNRTANATSFVIDGHGYLVFGEQTVSGGNIRSNKLWEFTPGILASLDASSLDRSQVTGGFGQNGLRFSLKGLAGIKTDVYLLDLQGQEIARWEVQGQDDWEKEAVSTEGLPGGIYLLKVQREGERPLMVKLLKSI